MQPTLSLLGITKHYDAIAALTDVSFDVLPGEVHALLGENGAGKSTLMNVASGTTTPDAGTIIFDEAPVDSLTPALAQDLGIAIVHQHPALLPDMTVAENIRVAVGLEHLRRRDPDVDEGDARAARRRPLPGAPRGPRLVPQRRPPPPARARQGIRRLAAAADSRRADGAALAGFRRAPLHGGPQARGRRHGHRLHHAPAGRGARDRRSCHRPARRQASRDVRGQRHLRRRPARHDHRAHARDDLPPEARGRGRRGAAPAGRGAERERLRRHLVHGRQGRDRGRRRCGRQRPAGAPARSGRARAVDRIGQRRGEESLTARTAQERGLHAGRPPDRGPDGRPERAREHRDDRARPADGRPLREPGTARSRWSNAS